MSYCFFVSDLHGSVPRYEKLFNKVEEERPEVLFLGGDLLPSFFSSFNGNDPNDFFQDILLEGFLKLKANLGNRYPRVFLILGNDDGAYYEDSIVQAEKLGIWN